MWNDTELQHDVENEVCWEVPAARTHISVTVKAGAVQLAGHVDSYWEKCAAETAAWRVAHVHQVTNGIRVVLPFDKQKDDDEIALSAMTILQWNAQVPESVELYVKDSVMHLTGSVERQQHQQEAVRALLSLRGITDIVNEITLRPAAVPSEAKAPIEAALKRNALVDSSRVKVHVAHGVAVLRGATRSKAEHSEVMHAVWTTPGIVKVEDHLTIGFSKGE